MFNIYFCFYFSRYIFIFSTRISFKKHLIFYGKEKFYFFICLIFIFVSFFLDIHLFIQHEIHLRNILFSMVNKNCIILYAQYFFVFIFLDKFVSHPVVQHEIHLRNI
jgi:hypothetical protein